MGVSRPTSRPICEAGFPFCLSCVYELIFAPGFEGNCFIALWFIRLHMQEENDRWIDRRLLYVWPSPVCMPLNHCNGARRTHVPFLSAPASLFRASS